VLGRELQLDLAGRHAARRGDYRVICTIDRSAGVVLIVQVDHRADVYR
jgi:mRNA-degrading endonuclease RelE of RelBE toxin-antitoxin system